jgi:hypothetical protein
MDRAKKDRKFIRSAFTRNLTAISNILKEDVNYDVVELKAFWVMLGERYEALKKLDAQIYSLMIESEIVEEEISQEVMKVEECNLKYKMIQQIMDKD